MADATAGPGLEERADASAAAEADAQTVAYTITYLEMTAPPQRAPVPKPISTDWPGVIALMRAEAPPPHYFRYLYDAVGAQYHWTDMHATPPEELAAFVGDPKVELWPLMRGGVPVGFFQLDFRAPKRCDLAYFGLTPEAVGRRLGPWLLDAAVREAWSRGIEAMTVNTCTLDHPAALAMYQRAGFAPIRREEATRLVRTPV